MEKKDTTVLIDGLKKLAAHLAELAAQLESTEDPTKERDAPAEELVPASQAKTPVKVWTLEEARAVLAEKSRTGFRSEVKAILAAHGAKQLSAITDPEELADIVAEAEVVGNG